MPGRSFVAALTSPLSLFVALGAAAAFGLTGQPEVLWAMGSVLLSYAAAVAVVPGVRRWVSRNARAQSSVVEGLEGKRATPEGLAALSPSQRAHYDALVALTQRIVARYRTLPGGSVVLASTESRLDELLAAFVRLVGTLNAYRAFLGAGARQVVETELASLQAEVAGAATDAVREVKARRVDILKKRLVRYVEAEEHREVVSHQLAGIEDLLHLTHEQSIALRDPDAVNRQLEALSAEVMASHDTLRELTDFMQAVDEGVGGSVRQLGPERVR